MERYAGAGHVPWCAIGSISRLLRTVAMTKTCERSVDKKFKMLDMQRSHLDPFWTCNAHTQFLK